MNSVTLIPVILLHPCIFERVPTKQQNRTKCCYDLYTYVRLYVYTYVRTDIHRAVLFIHIYITYLYSNVNSNFCIIIRCLKSNVRMERDCVREAISPSPSLYKPYVCSMYIHTSLLLLTLEEACISYH